jgi:hypothetical protein
VKLRPNVGLLIFLAAAGVIIIASIHKRAEPTHKGKPLSCWLRQYDLNTPTDSDQPEFKAERDVAAAAIRSIGTNAVPYLVTMARHDQPAWQSTLVLRSPGWVRRFIGVSGIFSDDPGEDAAIGFMILGTNAHGAIPDIVKLMADKTHPLRARRATLDLSYLGPKALPFIATEISKNTAGEPYFYDWLLTNNILPTVTGSDQLTMLMNELDNQDDRIAASNTISRIAPQLLTKTPPH